MILEHYSRKVSWALKHVDWPMQGEEQGRAATDGINGEEDAAARLEEGLQLPMMMAMSPEGMQLDHAEMQPEYGGVGGPMGELDGQEFVAFASPSAQDHPQGPAARQPSGSSIEVERWVMHPACAQ